MPRSTPRLYMAVTSHGYGHLSLCASVAQALRQRAPAVHLTVECALDISPFFSDVVHERESLDFGLVMRDALTIDREASAARYGALHADWEGGLTRATECMARHRPDGVLACSGYLAVAAARRLGVPVLGLGPLNWYDIGRFLFGNDPGMAPVLAHMAEVYAQADGYLYPTPSMPQTHRGGQTGVGVISRPVVGDREALAEALGLDPAKPMALVNFGGLASGLDARHWARDPGRWSLLSHGVPPREEGVLVEARHPDWPFPRLLASVDAVVGKAGYGMIADCATAGRPMLLVERPDWPEAPHLEGWFAQVGRFRRLGSEALAEGCLGRELDALMDLGGFDPVPATGADEVAEALLALA